METARLPIARPSLLALVLASAIGLAAAGAWAKTNPYAQPDESWISISGKVKSVSPDTFLLDYGKGIVTVEMDDGDRDADAYKLLEGDRVTVHGRVDDDLYETTTIEASSVYVEKLGTYFYASSLDEEDYVFAISTFPVVTASTTLIQGTVTDVRDEEFTINTGLRSLNVEVEEMTFNPLDDEGLYRVRVGDVVRVTGTMDDDFFEGRELVANSVVTISR